jgi:hypothetical protein
VISFAAALAIGTAFWSAHNVHVPCHPQPEITAEAAMPTVNGIPAEMATYGVSTCRIMIGPTALAFQREYPDYYCGEIVHELGHIAGLEHTASHGIMDAVQILGTTDWIPKGCKDAARRDRELRARYRSCRGTRLGMQRACLWRAARSWSHRRNPSQR